MKVIHAHDLNFAYPQALHLMSMGHRLEHSRNGDVLYGGSVTTVYTQPMYRVLFDAQRDANPFFHLFEALWMLSGANDVLVPAHFVPRMAEYSDDGQTFHGAYGHRWRVHWHDQLKPLIEMLHRDPTTRRAVLTMWSPYSDLAANHKDVPCNLIITFQVHEQRLEMCVFCRSNDIIWGCYGANVVHFSFLHEYVASRLGLAMGPYEHVSVNWHAYLDVWRKVWPLEKWRGNWTLTEPSYTTGDAALRVHPRALMNDAHTFDRECADFVQQLRSRNAAGIGYPHCQGYTNTFFLDVAAPLAQAHHLHKHGDSVTALWWIRECIVDHGRVDWLVAAEHWLARRVARQNARTEDRSHA